MPEADESRTLTLTHLRADRFELRHPLLPEPVERDLSALNPHRYSEGLDDVESASLIEELRWNLERHPVTKQGAPRAEAVRGLLERWGQALGEAILRDLDEYGVAEDLSALHVRAPGNTPSDPAEDPLTWPWAAARFPDGTIGLTGSVSCARRRRSSATQRGGPVRVVLVSPRDPNRRDEVSYRSVSEALIEYVSWTGLDLELIEVQPATLEALRGTLRALPRVEGATTILHVDGHGLAGGVLKLEEPPTDGQYDANPGLKDASFATLIRPMRQAGVQLVVMTACESAATGGALHSSAADEAARAADAVVAMRWKLHVDASRLLVTGFYGELLERGTSVGEAMTEARSLLHGAPKRVSQDMPVLLQDWVTPILVGDAALRLPAPARSGALADCARHDIRPNGRWPLPRVPDPRSADDSGWEGLPCRFTGRERELNQISRSWHRVEAIVLSGPEGSGRTSLALWALTRLAQVGRLKGRVFLSQEAPQSAADFLRAALAWARGRQDGDLPTRCAQALQDGDVLVLDALSEGAGAEMMQRLVALPEFQGKRLVLIAPGPVDLGPRALKLELGALPDADARVLGARLRQAENLQGQVRTEALALLRGLTPQQVLDVVRAVAQGEAVQAAMERVKQASEAPSVAAQATASASSASSSERERLGHLSKVGLLAEALMQVFDTPFDVHEWVKQDKALAPLARSLPFHSVSGAATRLASLLVGRGYLDEGLFQRIEAQTQGDLLPLELLRKRLK